MAIKIFCDLCECEREIAQVKGVEVSGSGLVLTAPSMASGHFVCEECLAKIGWSAGANLTDQTDRTDLTDNADGRVAAREAGRKAAKRRRGVEVVLTWKNNGEFDVCTSIAAAVDLIAAKTGVVVTGADISHALLKDKVYNADVFTVKYANNRPDVPDIPERQQDAGTRTDTDGNGCVRSGTENAGADVARRDQQGADTGAAGNDMPFSSTGSVLAGDWFVSKNVRTAANAEKAAGE